MVGKLKAFITPAILFLCSALLILSPILSSNTSALSATDGTQETLMQKLYIGAIKDAFDSWVYYANERTAQNIPSSRLTQKMSNFTVILGPIANTHIDVTTGVLIEYASQGKLDNGTVWMDGTQGDNFWNAAFTALGIPGTSPIDIICHGVTKGATGYEGAWILKPRLATYSDGSIPEMELQPECRDAAIFDALFTLPGDAFIKQETPARDIFRNNALGGVNSFLQANSTAPKAADGSLELKLSDLEEYYLHRKVFLSGCVASENPLQDSMNFTDPKFNKNNLTLKAEDFRFSGFSETTHGHSNPTTTGSSDVDKFFKIWVIGSSNTPEVQFFEPRLQVGGPSYLNTEFFVSKNEKMSCFDLANRLSEGRAQQLGNKLLAAGVQAQVINAVGPSSTNPGNNPGGGSDPCYDAAGSMNWILCPIITGLGEFMSGVYDDMVEPLLRIDAALISSDPDSGTFQAWSTFQTFANIAFIILLLVVIFSQITGFGIDNYGIKKILPKLVITAVLINLSYILCQLAVDISNILGFGATALLQGIADNLPTGALVKPEGTGIANFLTVLVGGAGVLALAGTLAGGWAIIIPALFTLLSGAIAVLFAFILLGVRQAGVVLLVAIAPLAVVCYMLPNTKKLFDRWVKMFQGLLLLFPICGLVVGGGYLASRILLSTGTDNFFTHLIAILLLVIPFFFIPMLLKNSFAAMGNIGGKISSLGKRVDGKVQKSGRPALEKSRFGQWTGRGKAYRDTKRAEANKFRQAEFSKAQAGAYTGNNLLLRGRSRANEALAGSRLPFTNNIAQDRDKRYRHMDSAGNYDGSIGKFDVNESLQGLSSANVYQADRGEDGNFKVQKKNRLKSRRGTMASDASRQGFDATLSGMSAKDIRDADGIRLKDKDGKDMGGSYGALRNMYNGIADMTTADGNTETQATKIYDDHVQYYRALGHKDDDAAAEAKAQLGFDRESAGSVTEFALHALKDESRRRASEMNKRADAADTEAAAAALGRGKNDGGNPQGQGGGDDA